MRFLKTRCCNLRQKVFALVQQNRQIAEAAYQQNIQRIVYTAPPLAFVSLTVTALLTLSRQPVSSFEASWRMKIISIHLATVGITILFWSIAKVLSRGLNSTRTTIAFQYAVIIYVLGLGIVLTLVDQLVTTGVTAFLICVTIAGTFYYFRPSRALVIFILAFLTYAFTLIKWTYSAETHLVSNLTNGFIASLVGYCLSLLTWNNFRVRQVQKQQLEKQRVVLENMAYHDSLTGLPNRRFLDDLIKREISLVERGQTESCLVVFDLDGFKTVNDTFGHPVGDQVLKQLAIFLQNRIQGSNTLFRLGGEEFIVLASNSSLQNTIALAERLRSDLADHVFLIGGQSINLTASFGVAPVFSRLQSKNNCYYYADQALYRAKSGGKNRVESVKPEEIESA